MLSTEFSHRNFTFYLFLFLISIFLLFDIGNPDAIRERDEVYYLFSFSNWINIENLNVIRGLITISSLGAIVYVSFWMQRFLDIPKVESLFFFTCSFGFIRFSRTFMPELPIALSFFVCALLYFQYLKSKSLRSFSISAIFLLIMWITNFTAALILVISIFTFTLYQWLLKGINISRSFLIWSVLTLLIAAATSTFILNTSFNTFTFSLFQSSFWMTLILYSFPSIFFIIPLIKRDIWKKMLKSDVIMFHLIILSIIVLISSTIDLSAKGMSLVALPFLITLLLFGASQYRGRTFYSSRRIGAATTFLILTSMFFLFINFFALTFPMVSQSSPHLIRILVTAVFLCSSLLLLYLRKNLAHIGIASFAIIASIWILFAPVFYLPTIPLQVSKDINTHYRDSELAIYASHSYFFQQVLGRAIKRIEHTDFLTHLSNQNDTQTSLLLIPESSYLDYDIGVKTEIIHRWPIWKRGNTRHEIFRAVRAHDLERLMEYILIIKNTD